MKIAPGSGRASGKLMAVVIPRPLAAAPSNAAYSARSKETPATPTPPMSLLPR